MPLAAPCSNLQHMVGLGSNLGRFGAHLHWAHVTPAIHAAVRVACDGRERRCRCCGRDGGEELHGGEDGVKERLVWMSFV